MIIISNHYQYFLITIRCIHQESHAWTVSDGGEEESRGSSSSPRETGGVDVEQDATTRTAGVEVNMTPPLAVLPENNDEDHSAESEQGSTSAFSMSSGFTDADESEIVAGDTRRQTGRLTDPSASLQGLGLTSITSRREDDLEGDDGMQIFMLEETVATCHATIAELESKLKVQV